MSNFTIGLDLGQAQDFTALAVVERVPQMELEEVVRIGGAVDTRRVERAVHLHCRHLERYELGTRYPTIAGKVTAMMQTPMLRGAPLIVDATGVGAAVVDMLRQAGLRPIPVIITGGDKAHHEDGVWKVPKRDLVASVQVPLQDKRLKFADGMPLVSTLISEMLAFKVKISDSAHDSYGSWREGEHDDLALAVMLASWAAQRITPRTPPRSREY